DERVNSASLGKSGIKGQERFRPQMAVIQILLNFSPHLLVGNGYETANVILVVIHYSTVNLKNVHALRPREAIELPIFRQSGLSPRFKGGFRFMKSFESC